MLTVSVDFDAVSLVKFTSLVDQTACFHPKRFCNNILSTAFTSERRVTICTITESCMSGQCKYKFSQPTHVEFIIMERCTTLIFVGSDLLIPHMEAPSSAGSGEGWSCSQRPCECSDGLELIAFTGLQVSLHLFDQMTNAASFLMRMAIAYQNYTSSLCVGVVTVCIIFQLGSVPAPLRLSKCTIDEWHRHWFVQAVVKEKHS